MVYDGGSGPGIRTKFARFIDYRLTIMALMNLDDVDVDSIVYGIANVLSLSGHDVMHGRAMMEC